MKNLIFAVTGASGGILAKRALEYLAGTDITTHIVCSEAGGKVYGYETGTDENRTLAPHLSVYPHNCRSEQNCVPINTVRETDACASADMSNVLKRDIEKWISRGANFRVYDDRDLFAPIASGSFPADAAIIMPCSMSTAAKIAAGIGDTLITRMAACCIKEKTPCVIVPRESPLSAIHLQNLLTLSQNGVYIMPPVPAFYDRAADFTSATDATVGRVLRTAGVENGLYARWGAV